MTETTEKLAMLHFHQRLVAALEVLATGRISEAHVMLRKLKEDVEVRTAEDEI